MTPFLVGAVAALGFAGYMLWQCRRSSGLVTRLVTTETSSVADVRALAEAAAQAAGPGSFAHRVELTGTAVAGERGPLTSEITDTPCLWYRHKVTHHFQERYETKEGHRRTRRKEEVVSDHWTKDPFRLRDATGDITVVPTAKVNGPRKVAGEFRQDSGSRGRKLELGSFSVTLPSSGDRTLGYEYEEWVLPVDARVFVSGEAFDDRGGLEVRGPTGPDALIVSTRSEEELLEHHRGENRKQQLLAGVGAVAAVGLLVAAFVVP